MKEIGAELIRKYAPIRPIDGHKYTFGTSIICGGSENYWGAPILAISSSLRSGTGVVRALVPDHIRPLLITKHPSATLISWGSDDKTIIEAISKSNACGIGPGLDLCTKALELLKLFITYSPRLVIDAGALSLLNRYEDELLDLLKKRKNSNLSPCIITPHEGEFSRLVGIKGDRLKLEQKAKSYASENYLYVVLKGHRTTVFTPAGEALLYEGGNDGMSKGGTGDVLTGLMTGILSQEIDELGAIISSIYFMGRAGDICKEKLTKRFMLPEDIISSLGEAYKEVGWN